MEQMVDATEVARQYRTESRLDTRRTRANAPMAARKDAPVTNHRKVNKTRTLSNGLQQCQPPDTIRPVSLFRCLDDP